MEPLANYNHPDDIEYVKIADHTCGYDVKTVLTKDVDIQVDVFNFYHDEVDLSKHLPLPVDEDANGTGEMKTALPQAQVMSLPSRCLDGVWDSLVFNSRIQYSLLGYIIRRISISARQLSHGVASTWSRVLLLHGPPGTGKTSLCQALAQRLSIRLGSQFPFCKLVKVDAQSVFSKWFSESGKMVTKLFGSIEAMLDEDEHTFICVLIDEIESLAGIRQHTPGANEPKDALRVQIAPYSSDDRLRYRPNVVVMCTSNLIKAMVRKNSICQRRTTDLREKDPAFLDRVARKHFIPFPCAAARYEILRSKYLEMAKCGIVIVNASSREGEGDNDSSQTLLDDSHHQLSPSPLDHNTLPHFLELPFQRYSASDCEAQQLWQLAQRCEGLSGRTLRDLPEDSLSLHTTRDPLPISEALTALSAGVEEHLVTE
ncbi:MAG: hypothetical protein Q9217_004440 [Psora testacea]